MKTYEIDVKCNISVYMCMHILRSKLLNNRYFNIWKKYICIFLYASSVNSQYGPYIIVHCTDGAVFVQMAIPLVPEFPFITASKSNSTMLSYKGICI